MKLRCKIGIHKWRYDHKEPRRILSLADKNPDEIFCRTCLLCGLHQANPHDGVVCIGDSGPILNYPVRDYTCERYNEVLNDMKKEYENRLKDKKKKIRKKDPNCKYCGGI